MGRPTEGSIYFQPIANIVQAGVVLNGRYLIVRELSSGGFGKIFLAQGQQLHKSFAVAKIQLRTSRCAQTGEGGDACVTSEIASQAENPDDPAPLGEEKDRRETMFSTIDGRDAGFDSPPSRAAQVAARSRPGRRQLP